MKRLYTVMTVDASIVAAINKDHIVSIIEKDEVCTIYLTNGQAINVGLNLTELKRQLQA